VEKKKKFLFFFLFPLSDMEHRHHVRKDFPPWDANTSKAINGLRVLAADMVQQANSGHPGAPMGMAPMAFTLFTRFMKHDPAHPRWIGRDRFVLSNGHACALLYSVLHLSGYHFTLDDLKAFRQVGSKTPGHPEAGPHPENDGIEVTTGPLGQGLASAVGLALSERHMAATFNQPGFEIINNFTYVFCGDGCLQEGITSEASSLAGHLGLGKLIVLYDSNYITIDGETDLSFSEDVAARYRAYGWQVLQVDQGDFDLEGIAHAIDEARAEVNKPSLIIVNTTIGFGSGKQGSEAVHGSPLGADDLAAVKRLFGFDPAQKFVVPQESYDAFDARAKGQTAFNGWHALLDRYAQVHPLLAAELVRRSAGLLPSNWKEGLPVYTPEGKAEATRVSSGLVLNALSTKLPEIIGGSADLNPSTMTYLKSSIDFQKLSPAGRNIRFGVREHAMAAICNGIAFYGALIPFGSTFLNFLGYCVRRHCLFLFGLVMFLFF
jgi:transketolase